MNNTNETKWNAGVRRTESGLFNYEVLSGYTCICERTTASQSPGTLATFQQIAREHNERPELIEALQAVDKLTCNVPLMSREVRAHFERNPAADAYRCELNKLLLEIRSVTRAQKAPAVEQWVPPASTVTCPKCGNYYGGHATGSADICDCHEARATVKPDDSGELRQALISARQLLLEVTTPEIISPERWATIESALASHAGKGERA